MTNEADLTPAAPVVEPTPAPAEIPAAPPESTPKAPESRRDVLAREFQKPSERGKHAQHQPRDNGKFAGPPVVPPEAKSPPPVPTAPAAVAPQRPEMPKSLKLELKQHWEAAHPELAAAIHQRELDYEKGVMPLKEKAKLADDLMAEFQPYEMMMRAENVTPKASIAEFMRIAALLRTGSPVHKAQTVAGFMRQFGIPIEHVQQMLTSQSGPAPTQPVHDPQYSQLAQQVQQLQATYQQQAQARVEKEIEAFAAQPEHKHFATVQDDMLRFINATRDDPEMASKSEREKLEAAYQKAIWANETVRQQLLAEQQAKQQTDAQIAAAKNAAVQVTGAPSSGPAPPVNPKDRLAFLRNQFQTQR